VKLTRGEREVDDVSDCRDENRCTFLEKPSERSDQLKASVSVSSYKKAC